MVLPKKYPCLDCGKVVALSGFMCHRGKKPTTAAELEKLAAFMAKVTCGCRNRKPADA